MAKLIYTAIASLDGYTEDANGDFDWSAPDAEVHAFVNDVERPIGTYLLGRRMYEVMTFWETVDTQPASLSTADLPPVEVDFASIWQAADKIVYSSSLDEPTTTRTTLERSFEPDAVRRLKENAAADLSIGGAELAGLALRAGLVDELHLYLNPIVVGGGKAALPAGLHLDLELLDEHRFTNGVVHLHYAVR
jgi:dihydrofolate reductase